MQEIKVQRVAVALTIASLLVVALVAFTRLQVRRIERRYPPVGDMIDAAGFRFHTVHVPGRADADLPPVIFLHGASGNLRDQMWAFRSRLEGRADLIFIDRPGHGWSERGDSRNRHPAQQARSVAALLDSLGIEKAIVVGHSFGGAIAASMALEVPERVCGLLLLSAPTHPWPGGIALHSRLASTPVAGHVFTELLTLPVGLTRITGVARCVFQPNAYPPDYLERTGTALVLRPRSFRHNARDVASLYAHVVRSVPRYGQINTPTVVITGDEDTIVSSDLHSEAIARQIEGARLIRLRGIGHKPDFAATDLCIAALEHIAGMDVDLEAAATAAEQNVARQRQTSGDSVDVGPGKADQMPLIPSDPI